MSVDINFGESARSIREKAMQDRDNVRVRMAKVEQEMLDLRQQDRDLTSFLKTLDRYDPQPPAAVAAPLRSPARFYGGGEAVEVSASARALQTAVDNLQRGRREVDTTVAAIRAGGTVADAIREGAIIAGMHYLPERIAPTKKLPRPGTNMRKVTDAAHLYLELMDHFATTDQLVNYLRSQDDVFQLLGTRPAPTLSSYLSRDPRFDYQRPKGWTLSTETVDEASDQGGGDDDDSQQEGGLS